MTTTKEYALLVDAAAQRGADIFGKAIQKFMNQEKRRRPNLQVWVALAAAADGLGAALAAAMWWHKPMADIEEAKQGLHHLLELARLRGEAFLEWHAGKPPP